MTVNAGRATSDLVRRWAPTAGWGAAFVVLSTLVRFGALDGFDARVRAWVRPGDVWGDPQIRADYVVEGLRPPVLVTALALLVVVVAVRQRSVRPLVVAALVAITAGVLTAAAQWVVARPDPHGVVHRYGGSYPSGHTLTAVVGLALAAHLLRPASRVLPISAAVGAAVVMGGALVVQVTHWAGDVLGGCLLAAAVVSALLAADGHRPHTVRSPGTFPPSG